MIFGNGQVTENNVSSWYIQIIILMPNNGEVDGCMNMMPSKTYTSINGD